MTGQQALSSATRACRPGIENGRWTIGPTDDKPLRGSGSGPAAGDGARRFRFRWSKPAANGVVPTAIPSGMVAVPSGPTIREFEVTR